MEPKEEEEEEEGAEEEKGGGGREKEEGGGKGKRKKKKESFVSFLQNGLKLGRVSRLGGNWENRCVSKYISLIELLCPSTTNWVA